MSKAIFRSNAQYIEEKAMGMTFKHSLLGFLILLSCLIHGCSKDPVAQEIKRLQDNNENVRVGAAEVLGESNDPRAIRPLIVALSDESSDVSNVAELALIKFGTPVKEPSGINITDSHWRLFDLTLWPFVTKPVFIDGPVSDATISALLTTPKMNDKNLYRPPAKVLARIPNPQMIELLATVLKDDESSVVRVVAAEALGKIKDPRVVHPLIACIKDSEPGRIQEVATQALAEMREIVIETLHANGPLAVESLLVLANSPNEGLKENALKALAIMGIERTLTNSIGLKLVYITPGAFMMGSPASEEHRDSDEGPQHRVRISKAFYMAETELTQAQYWAVMGTDPSHFKGSVDLPVENVSWHNAVEFCRRLSEKEGRSYRLPTEAEWEFACRAGTTTVFCFGNDLDASMANIDSFGSRKRRKKTIAVRTYKPNAWGLYDMHGNVYEWCSDRYDENYYSSGPSVDPKGPSSGQSRALRGGSWFNLPGHCRSAHRGRHTPDSWNRSIGFRLVLDLN